MASRWPYQTKAHGLHQMGLCQACNSLDIELLRDRRRHVHLENVTDILETSKGCRMCALVASCTVQSQYGTDLRRLLANAARGRRFAPFKLVVQIDGDGKLAFSSSENIISVSFDVFWEGGALHRSTIDQAVPTECGASRPRTRLLPDKDARQDMSVAGLLCAAVPKKCDCFTLGGRIAISFDQPEPFLPHRILDLKASAGSSKLALREGMMACKGRYIALSHRWGGDVPFKTTRQNICEYFEGMDAARLPQNFQDVFVLAELLGIRYVWIDALCIVQDDQDDWLAQARQMGSVYTNASITLALHQPRSSTEGFLWRMRVPEWLEISTRAARMKGLQPFWLRLPAIDEHFIEDAIRSGQITDRGWCLQELWLSTRILHVVEDKFIWRCPHSRDTDNITYIVRESIPFDNDIEASSACWHRLVRRYSRCELTMATDKLPALSGIHSLWPKSHIQRSHCGHLGINVHTGLLWYRERGNSITRIRGRAPSWS